MKKTLLITTFISFIGCSKKTKVLLLDSGKARNAIVVSTNKGSKLVNKIGGFVELIDKNQPPSTIKIMPKDDIYTHYSRLFNIEPTAPRTYIVYFKKNSKELKDASKILLNQAIEEIKRRSACVVDIIGHTDTVGLYKANAKISLDRANYIKNMIKKRRVPLLAIQAKGYGEEDLLMKTSDNVSEKRNRNVEIFIK